MREFKNYEELPKLRPTELSYKSGREKRILNRKLARERFGKRKLGY